MVWGLQTQLKSWPKGWTVWAMRYLEILKWDILLIYFHTANMIFLYWMWWIAWRFQKHNFEISFDSKVWSEILTQWTNFLPDSFEVVTPILSHGDQKNLINKLIISWISCVRSIDNITLVSWCYMQNVTVKNVCPLLGKISISLNESRLIELHILWNLWPFFLNVRNWSYLNLWFCANMNFA